MILFMVGGEKEKTNLDSHGEDGQASDDQAPLMTNLEKLIDKYIEQGKRYFTEDMLLGMREACKAILKDLSLFNYYRIIVNEGTSREEWFYGFSSDKVEELIKKGIK